MEPATRHRLKKGHRSPQPAWKKGTPWAKATNDVASQFPLIRSWTGDVEYILVKGSGLKKWGRNGPRKLDDFESD